MIDVERALHKTHDEQAGGFLMHADLMDYVTPIALAMRSLAAGVDGSDQKELDNLVGRAFQFGYNLRKEQEKDDAD